MVAGGLAGARPGGGVGKAERFDGRGVHVIDLIKAVDPWLETGVLLAILWLVYRVVNGSWRFWQLAVGVDGRYSSSRFHGLCWTIVVFAAYTALYLARVHAGSTEAFHEIPPNVLTALGLSLGTTAAAAGITSSRVARNTVVKSHSPHSDLSFAALVEDDEGNPDLAKAQLMVWTFVSLGVYIVATVDAVARTLAATNGALLPPLPDIDTTLLVLSGIGQGSYLATKLASTPQRRPSQAAPAALAAPTSVVATTTSVTADSIAAASPGAGGATAITRASVTVPTSVRVPGFTPSVNGLHFTNSFPSEPDLTFDLPGIGRIPIGDASNGLCGGMVFTVRDVFETRGLAPVPDVAQPAPGSPLFRYIVDRLIASFDIPHLGFMKYYDWMLTPDGDAAWPPLITRRGVAWRTIVEEWPARIQPELDAGRLCCLGLVTVASPNPAELGHNHQVMAYGYDLDGAGNLALHVYDPNTAQDQADTVTISLSLLDPEHATPIHHNVGIGSPIRGFFRTDYSYANPTGLLA